jgi:predicted amidophosphoribosyltransferase
MPRKSVRSPAEDTSDAPRQADLDSLDDVGRPCPNCRADLYDDAELCWKCGHALSGDAPQPKAWVKWAAIVLLMAFVVLTIVRAF